MPEVPSGNRNLLKNTKSFKGSKIGGSSTILTETYQDCAARYFKNTNPNSNYQNVAFFIDEVYPKLDGEYVLSFWAKGSGTITSYFNGASGYLRCASAVSSQGSSNNNIDGSMSFILSENWERYWVKYKLASSPVEATQVSKQVTFLHVSNSTEDEVYLAGVQLEEGNVVSDYSQAPEDLGWSSTPLVPTQQQRYLWKFEYIYYSDDSVEVTQLVNISIAGADADTTGVTAAISEIDSKTNSLRADLTNVSDSLSNAASQLQAQAAAQADLTSRVSTVEETANGTKTTVTELAKTVDDNTDDITSITQRTTAIETDLSGTKATLSQVQTTADTTTANLASYQASNDQAVASLQSSLQTTDGNVSSLQTQINAVPGQITSAVSAVEGKIPTNLGGRNYLRGTSDEYQTLTSDNYILGYTGNKNISFLDLLEPLKGKTVTIRSYIKNDTDFPIRIQVWFTGGAIYGNLVPAHEEGWSVGTGKILESFASCNVAFTQSGDGTKTGGTIRHKNDKLEIGNIPSDWSLAPEDTANQISSLSSQIQQTADGMTLLATKTELNTAKSDLQSGISTATSKADNAQATADSNAQTISTHTTQISALNTGLQAKVSQSDFDSLSGRVTTAESNLTATANQLSSQISSVENKIPDSVGAVNLLKNTKSFKSSLIGGSSTLTGETYQGCAVRYFKNTNSNSNYQNVAFFLDEVYPELGGEYVLSFWAKGSGTITSYFNGASGYLRCASAVSSQGVSNSHLDGSTTINLAADWQRFWVKYKLASSPVEATQVSKQVTFLHVSNSTENEVYLAGVQLEEGNVASGYAPNPEDYDAALTQAKSEIKQTTDSITANVSSVETKANNAQTTANSAFSKADAAQTAVNTLDGEVVKSASLNLDNNGFVTKVGKTIDGNKFATMIAQNANNVKIIADEMQVTADMIVDGAVTADKLNVSNLSAVNSNLGKIEGGSLLLQENKTASSSVDSWGTFNRPAHKQGLYMDNHGLASSGAIQRKNGSETTPTDMPLAVLQSGELRFLVVDYNDNLENVLHYGLSDPDYGAIRFEIDSELKRRLTMTSSGYLNFQATNYTNWQSTGVSGCEYMIQGRLVLVNYDVTFNSAGTHTIGGIPQEFTKKSLMMTAKAWTITPRDKNIQLNSDGSLHILDAEANVNYRGTLVFSY